MRKWIAVGMAAMCALASAHAKDWRYLSGAALSDLSLARDRVLTGTSPIGSYDTTASTEFIGYVIGTTDAFLANGTLCSPNGVSANQLAAIVSKYLKDHPDLWTLNGATIVFLALTPLLGCKHAPAQQ